MSNFQDKIDSLSYLYSPTSVKDFKKEINKLVEVLKEFPQLASPKDVQNIQDVVYKNYQKITYKVEGGFANTNYTTEDIVDFGNAETINTYIGYRYGTFNYPRWNFDSSKTTAFSVIWVESNTNWTLELRGDTSKVNVTPIQGIGNKLLLIVYDLTVAKAVKAAIKKKKTKKSKAKIKALDIDVLAAEENQTIMTLNKNVITLNKDINKDNLTIKFSQKTYKINVEVNPIGSGKATGGGEYYYNAYIKLEVTPNKGYVFNSWQDDDEANKKANPRYAFVTQDFTYVANLDKVYTISVISSPESYGTVSGGGEFKSGQQTTLKASPTSIYYIFDGWFLNGTKVSDELNYTITISEDAIYEAKFHYESKFYLILKDQLSGKIFDVTTINFKEIEKEKYLRVNKNTILLNKVINRDELKIETNLDWTLNI